MYVRVPVHYARGSHGQQETTQSSDAWGTGGGRGVLGRATAGLGGLSHTRPIVVYLPVAEQPRTLATKKSGKWSRRVEEAAEHYMKRWFVKENNHVGKRRTLGVQHAQKLKTPLGPRPPGGGGGEEPCVEGGVETAARLVKKAKAPSEAYCSTRRLSS